VAACWRCGMVERTQPGSWACLIVPGRVVLWRAPASSHAGPRLSGVVACSCFISCWALAVRCGCRARACRALQARHAQRLQGAALAALQAAVTTSRQQRLALSVVAQAHRRQLAEQVLAAWQHAARQQAWEARSLQAAGGFRWHR